MKVTDYFNSLPMDTRYYLLDYSAKPDKIKEVIGDKANDSAFFTEFMNFIKDTQKKRIADARITSRLATKKLEKELENELENENENENENEFEFRPRMDLIRLLTAPFEKRCKICGTPITAGEYCDDCGKQLISKSYV